MPDSPVRITVPHQPHSLLAAVLSYVVPGLGQIYQGRVAKGVLFMVCLVGMFVLGLSMGHYRNVYLPREVPLTSQSINVFGAPLKLPWPVSSLWHRKSFAGQVWIGALAWPAIWQFLNMPMPDKETNPFWHFLEKAPSDAEQNPVLVAGDKTYDLAWIYTVIAGVLNILVIYDAFAGPAFPPGHKKEENNSQDDAAATKEAAVS